jgi:hypothetical protein
MTSPLNPDPTLSPAHASSSSGPPTVNHSASHPYSPSVPISVYRELSAELSSTRIQMETYKFQNQQLVEQNQKLRLEIERVVQSTLYLRQVADGYTAVRGEIDDAPLPPIAPPVARTTPKPQRPAPKRSKAAPPLFTEQPEPQGQRGRDRLPKEINGWWLTVIIGVIVITAFGTGFLLVRPLLPSR